MTKYCVCYNPNIKNSENVLEKLEIELKKNCCEYNVLNIEKLELGFDFIFVIGGDGTILKAARYYSKSATPIFGINLGHLGFLSQASENDLENAVNQIVNNKFNIEKRLMLKAGNYTALNDFVIKGETSSRATNFSLEIDGKYVCDYFADGLIISTPTGSTAYSMAAGGPILTPDINAFSITPICPHTFSARPLVVSSDSIIKIISKPDYKYCVSADGQEVFTFEKELMVSKSELDANLALLSNNDFFSIIRNKLKWGYSPYKGK